MSSIYRKRIFDQQPPANYVAGMGRGATGFTTRSDIGPARLAPDTPAPSQASAAEKDEGGDYSDAQFDAWSGFSENLFQGMHFDADDDAADRMYEAVDDHMDMRRKRQREAREQAETEKYRSVRPKIQQLFSDLKKGLAGVSKDEWASIPDMGDYSIKRKKQEIWTPIPDSVLGGTVSAGHASTLDSKQQTWGGMATPEGATPVTDLRAMGEARGSLLSVRLKQISDSVTGQTVVDPKGYLTNLNNMKITNDSEIGDLKRARLLLKSVTTTNPHHGPGWIAAARVEEIAGRIAVARKIIAEGCEACPMSEDVWLEAVRLQTPANAKVVLAKAVEKLPHSVKLWIQAAQLEQTDMQKKIVLRKALEIIPNSVRLWKELIELETPEDARILLSRAVECVNNVDLWLALAKLESYDNAKKVLNKAREANPTEAMIWVTAAELEEANDHPVVMENIIKKAVKSMAATQMTREQWLQYAETAEKAGHPKTCQAIVIAAAGLDLDDTEKKHTWIADAEKAIASGCIATARAIYAHALKEFPAKKGLWLRAAQLERDHGSHEELDRLLKTAVSYCPKAEVLWLMAAKEKWLQGDIKAAREILSNAFKANADSEQIWLAAVKLESENGETERARLLLEKARERADTPRIWMKSAKLERSQGARDAEKALLIRATEKWPKQLPGNKEKEGSVDVVSKLWLMLLQWEVRTARDRMQHEHPKLSAQERIEDTQRLFEHLRASYTQAYRNCPESIPVWTMAAEIEEQLMKDVPKARALLDKAKLRNPKSAALWVALVRLEHRNGNEALVQMNLAKALQECPTSGLVWAEAIELEPPASKKAKSKEALKRNDKDPRVVAAVAKLFWLERKADKARSWFGRARALDSNYGDAWAYSYRLEMQYGTEESQKEMLRKAVEADPKHGERWVQVAKAPENVSVGGCRLSTEQLLRKVALLCEVK
nr:U5 snRNP-associated 102 kDa protein (U5-102 kDa protein) [Euglena gracilis]